MPRVLAAGTRGLAGNRRQDLPCLRLTAIETTPPDSLARAPAGTRSLEITASTETPVSVRGTFPIDSHVHFYPCFDRDRFFDGALANFQQASGVVPHCGNCAGGLLLAESSDLHYFRQFRATADRPTGGPWRFRTTDEPDSLVAQRDGSGKLLLVAGRQIITAEGLEVLALCCDAEFIDGLPLSATVHAAKALGAMVVLPWGFGKWSFRRGVLIAEFIRSVGPADIYLGDNGGRLQVGRRPVLFHIAESRGMRILAGSDPLALHHETKRIGSYGSVVAGTVDLSRPVWSLKRLLRTHAPVQPYGRRLGPIAFCKNQLLIRAIKARPFARAYGIRHAGGHAVRGNDGG